MIIIDTGVIVALLDKDDQFHAWAVSQLKELAVPFHTCEAVLAEAFFLLSRVTHGTSKLIELLRRLNVILIENEFESASESIFNLMDKYRNIPANFADAYLIQMAEKNKKSKIWTVDKHFTIYRIHRRQKINLIFPS